LLVEKGKKTEKVPYLLGISRNQIIIMDAEKEVRPLRSHCTHITSKFSDSKRSKDKREELNITWLKRWSASDSGMTNTQKKSHQSAYNKNIISFLSYTAILVN
jgi:hypothetical protein